MLDFDAALALLLEGVTPAAAERVLLLQAAGRVLAEPVLARHTDFLPEGTAVSVAVRPEKIDVHEQRPAADNVAVGKVRDIAYLGDVSIYHVQTEEGATIRVQETHVERSSEPHYDWDDTLWLSWPATGAVVLAS